MSEVTSRIIAYQNYLNRANQHLALARKGAWDEVLELESSKSLHQDLPPPLGEEAVIPTEEREILTDLFTKVINAITEFEALSNQQRAHLESLIGAADEREKSGKAFGKVITSGTYGARELFGKPRR